MIKKVINFFIFQCNCNEQAVCSSSYLTRHGQPPLRYDTRWHSKGTGDQRFESTTTPALNVCPTWVNPTVETLNLGSQLIELKLGRQKLYTETFIGLLSAVAWLLACKTYLGRFTILWSLFKLLACSISHILNEIWLTYIFSVYMCMVNAIYKCVGGVVWSGLGQDVRLNMWLPWYRITPPSPQKYINKKITKVHIITY